MIAPGALVMLAPILTGVFFGVNAVYGLLTGGLLSGVQLAISMSNTGGAWDNCKKYIEGNVDPSLGGKGSEIHKAAVVGDTVGDPLKVRTVLYDSVCLRLCSRGACSSSRALVRGL
jgi:inorganic pyrophosphatase